MKTFGRLFAAWVVAGLFLGTSATAQQGTRAKRAVPTAKVARPAAKPKAPARPAPKSRPAPKPRPKVERPAPKARPKPTPKPKPTGPKQPAPAPFVGGEQSTIELQIVDLTNVERAKAGLPPLTWNNRLGAAAQGHTMNIVQTGVFEHEIYGSTLNDRIKAVGYRGSSWGENISFDFELGPATEPEALGPAERAVVGWMNSPGHRANILNPDFTELGVGVAIVVVEPAEAGGLPGLVFFATQDFGRPAR